MSVERYARAEAVRVYALPHEAPRNANERRANGIISAHRAGYVEGYIAGASREVTDERVERTAEALASIWGDAVDGVYRSDARAVLDAAREVGA